MLLYAWYERVELECTDCNAVPAGDLLLCPAIHSEVDRSCNGCQRAGQPLQQADRSG